MSLKVEVISREMVKPSLPTPQHLNTHQLSFLDQCAPTIYIPLIFFYPKGSVDPTEQSILLKASLANTLARFYPLAGRVGDETSIDCNDQGVEYKVANVASDLSEVTENPMMEELRELLPFEPLARDKREFLGVQVNHFACGGTAISVCIWHRMADGTALVDFITAWARETVATDGDDRDVITENPRFDTVTHFPPNELLSKIYVPKSDICMEKLVARRFVFSKEKIDALKEQAKSREMITNPTRVEVVSAFIWQRLIQAAVNRQAKSDPSQQRFVAAHAVSLRTRMTQPISSNSFGNIYWPAITEPVMFEPGFKVPEPAPDKLPELVRKMKEAIRQIDDGLIKMLQDKERCLLAVKELPEKASGCQVCGFSSWCRFPLYEVDFGWGKPIWVCTTTLPFKNVIILLSTRCGRGIEAWVSMAETDIALLEPDHEFSSAAPSMVEA